MKKSLILVADDQEINKKIFSIILRNLEYDSILVDDGQAAMEKAAAMDPAIVFMDIQMPVMDGYEAAKKLRAGGFNKPIIAVTAGTFSEVWENCQNAGFDDMVSKPVRQADIQNMILKWINAVSSRNCIRAGGENSYASPKPAVVFDSVGMLSNFMNQEEVVLPLLFRFIERTGSLLENFPDFKKTGDWERARIEAHKMRGTALSMGGMEFGQAAARLEQVCKNASEEEIEEAYLQAMKAFNCFKKEAEDFIRSRN